MAKLFTSLLCVLYLLIVSIDSQHVSEVKNEVDHLKIQVETLSRQVERLRSQFESKSREVDNIVKSQEEKSKSIFDRLESSWNNAQKQRQSGGGSWMIPFATLAVFVTILSFLGWTKYQKLIKSHML